MTSADTETGRLGSIRRTAAQRRILVAALDLFADHGVSGTSLQMIADALGVTKAAVYHQFKTKDEIIIAVTEMQLARLEDALEDAEAAEDRPQARELLLNRVIEMAVDQRRMVGVMQSDPVIIRFLAEHKPFQAFLERLYAALIGDDTGPETLVQAAMLSGAIGSAVKHPLVAHLDEATLRSHLLRLTRRLVALPG
ncbi:MAG TPA: helix-turn-helix domain-containing protein [Mycobacterium sp.]|nr:helix-turn-helix domain-containing protein [Mycobacterium sp.]